MIVILDNRDSFVHNVEHRLAELGVASRVVPSRDAPGRDRCPAPDGARDLAGAAQESDEAGISTAAIRTFGRDVPVLGICLGHQCIAVAFGVPVRPDTRACHGRSSPIAHDGAGLLAGVPTPFDAGRYHALAADEPAPDAELVVSARLAEDPRGLVGVRHRTLPVEGVQFHQAILTPDGYAILANLARRAGHDVDAALVERLAAAARQVLEPAA